MRYSPGLRPMLRPFLIGMSSLVLLSGSLVVGCATPRSDGAASPTAGEEHQTSSAPAANLGQSAAPAAGRSGASPRGGELAGPEGSPPVILRYPRGPRSWLGVEMRATGPEEAGVQVSRVFRGSPAARAGLLPGDVVVRWDQTPVDSPERLAELVDQTAPGTELPLGLLRGARPQLLRLRVDGKPDFEDRLRLAFVGLPAPSIDGIITFQGEATSLRDLRGEVVVLEFWASWCGVCRYLSPVLQRLQLEHRPAGLAVLGITVDPPERAREVALRSANMDYALASDPGGKVTSSYLASQVPTVFVIDRQGVVVDVMVGVAEERVEEFKRTVEGLLAPPG